MKESEHRHTTQYVQEKMGFQDFHLAFRVRNTLSKRLKNTPLARKLAKIYEEQHGIAFPGGIKNAYIERLRPGHWQRSEGAWSWVLSSISAAWREDNTDHAVREFGSAYPARECVKKPELIS